MTWHSSLSVNTGCGGHALCLLCLPTSLLQVFFGVCNSSSPQAHTHLGPPGRVEAEITATPLPLRTGWETPWCDRAEIAEKRGKEQVVSWVLCTHGRLKGCAYWLSYTCFPSAFSVLLILYSIFAHGSLSDLCILSGAGRMWFIIVR